MKQELILPSNIPWSELKGELLEETLFWLLDDLGAKNLQWRGSTHSSDGGRDLEAVFYSPSPDGELRGERWWIEAKGRQGTLEPQAVKDSVVNCQAHSEIDVLTIATNTRFSPATRDWVSKWQIDHPRPIVKLWERLDLERLVVNHPTVAARLFSDALSDQGKLEACSIRFWNQMYFPSIDDLHQLWRVRTSIEWSDLAVIAVTSGEITNGTIGRRPWLLCFDDVQLLRILTLSLTNMPYLVNRAIGFGIDPDRIARIVCHILLSAIHRIKPEDVLSVLQAPWLEAKGKTESERLKKWLLMPVLGRILSEVGDVCVSDCTRVDMDRALLSEDEVNNYWDQLRMPSGAGGEQEDEEKNRLIMENTDDTCKVGFELDEADLCPLVHLKSGDSLPRIVRTLQAVIQARLTNL